MATFAQSIAAMSAALGAPRVGGNKKKSRAAHMWGERCPPCYGPNVQLRYISITSE